MAKSDNATSSTKNQIAETIGEATRTAERAAALMGELTQRREELQRQRGYLIGRNAHLRTLPVKREDAKQAILDSIDHYGRDFPQRVWRRVFERFAYPQRGYSPTNSLSDPTMRMRPMPIDDIDDAASKGSHLVFNLGAFSPVTHDNDGGRIQIDAICFLFGDLIKRRIEDHFEELFPDYAVGRRTARTFDKDWAWLDADPKDLASSVADRRAEIARNVQDIERLGAQIEEIDADLAPLRAVSQAASAVGAPKGA